MNSITKEQEAKKLHEAKNKDKEIAGDQMDKSKLESEGACKKIIGKDENEVCDVKT
jgi:hypothetical protein